MTTLPLPTMLSWTQDLMIQTNTELLNINIPFPDFVVNQEIEINGKSFKVSEETTEMIILWIHEKKIKQMEMLESGYDEEFLKETSLNLQKYIDSVTQLIMRDLTK